MYLSLLFLSLSINCCFLGKYLYEFQDNDTYIADLISNIENDETCEEFEIVIKK